ncbi:unnamed protein product [Effrenium voratum]|nr:unnamed protein product [Effrenium voratum]
MLLRLVCGVILGATFFRFASDQEGWKTCDAAWLPWARYHSHLYSDADLCKEDPEISEWCETISGFERRCENSSASAALGFAEDMGLQCTNATELQLLSDLVDSDSWGHYCEANNGTKVNCSKDLWSHLDPHLVFWVEGTIRLDQLCEWWPSNLRFGYDCEKFFSDADCQKAPAIPETKWDAFVLEHCSVERCAASLPQWMQVMDEKERIGYCACESCVQWFRKGECTLEWFDQATRRISGSQQMYTMEQWQEYFSDPRFVIQFGLVATCVFGPMLWLLTSTIFLCCFGNPWSVPLDAELQDKIKLEEVALQEELVKTGRIEDWCSSLNRLAILSEVGFCVADFVTDIQMLFLYYRTYHYGFVVLQALMILRSFLEQTLRGHFLRLFVEAKDSLRANLRTDKLLSIAQAEKTGEATLSFLLQIYGFFYMSEELTSYVTAAISLLISARGLTQGCYIHFDLAFISSEQIAPIDIGNPPVSSYSILPGFAAAESASFSSLQVPEPPVEAPAPLDLPGEVQSDSLDQNCAPDTPDMNEPIPKVLGKGRVSPLRSDPVEVTPLSLAGKTKESEEPGNLQPAPDPNEPPVLGKGQNITIGL